MSKSVTKNYLYNMFYQVLILITTLKLKVKVKEGGTE